MLAAFQTMPSLLVRPLLQLMVQGGVRARRAVHLVHRHLRSDVSALGKNPELLF